jgi:hypothetical protein
MLNLNSLNLGLLSLVISKHLNVERSNACSTC